ncbi:polysaccharide deacetylase family protein [Deinococcus arenicola]|uniref:Polysaccharide deacetylase family protein n=1 Tax=Deinococcus arenicola TaxID=2994950 RepID=A0ABU4DRB3_9DEIO|nr:polysaccharide deacetylase family protein [Deinococcus sp. ZS9-10]MDV6374981.1 polysaccharide deacetylase family protein [Deinococcus sp. ZS9-10]
MNFPPNPSLNALGYSPRDRVVIFHADDLGMCQATVSAYQDLHEAGLLSSAAVMMPCAWASAAAQAIREFPTADVGVHWTLTSEWAGYRWGPLTCAPALTDTQGYFHAGVEEARHADAPTVRAELAAQLDRALSWGLDLTHVDAHMGTAAHPRYLPDLLELALSHGLPPLFPRQTAADWRAAGLTGEDARQAEGAAFELEERGVPLVDHLRMLPLDVGGDHAALTRQMLRDLPPGITHFILHPARDTPELRAICGDWRARVANYEAFLSADLRRDVENVGIQVIGYRPLRSLLRQRLQNGEVGA